MGQTFFVEHARIGNGSSGGYIFENVCREEEEEEEEEALIMISITVNVIIYCCYPPI